MISNEYTHMHAVSTSMPVDNINIIGPVGFQLMRLVASQFKCK